MELHIPIYLGKRNQSGLDGRYGMPCKPISVQVFRSSILKIKYLEESKELAIQITENLIIFHEHLSIPPSRKNIFLFFPARPLTKGEKTKYLKNTISRIRKIWYTKTKKWSLQNGWRMTRLMFLNGQLRNSSKKSKL